jgi:ubiquinone biosynthesis protein
MLWEMLNAARDLGRVHDIATVLIRDGFGGFVRSLGMSKALERAGRVLHWQHVEDIELDTPQRALRWRIWGLPSLWDNLARVLIYSRLNTLPSLKTSGSGAPIPLKSCCPSLKKTLAAALTSSFQMSKHKPLQQLQLPRFTRLRSGRNAGYLENCRPGLRKTLSRFTPCCIALLTLPNLNRWRSEGFIRKKSFVSLTSHYAVNSISPASVEMQNG